MVLLYTMKLGYDRGNCKQSGYFFAPFRMAAIALRKGADIHDFQVFALPVCIGASLAFRASRLVKSIEMLHTPAAPMIV